MNKVTAIIIGVLVVCFGGLVVWSVVSSQADAINVDGIDSTKVIEGNKDSGGIGDHVRGKEDSPVVLVEYADFQCPGCSTTHPKVTTLFKEYGNRVTFVFRNFPIPSIHPNAKAAAAAAEAAGMQGYFFEMAEVIYANQSIWSYASGAERSDTFADLFQQAAPAGNVEKFKADMASGDITKKIDFDYEIGAKKDKVTGTPSLHINGEHVDLGGSTSTEDFMKIMHEKLDAKLKEAGMETGAKVVEEDEIDTDDGITTGE